MISLTRYDERYLGLKSLSKSEVMPPYCLLVAGVSDTFYCAASQECLAAGTCWPPHPIGIRTDLSLCYPLMWGATHEAPKYQFQCLGLPV